MVRLPISLTGVSWELAVGQQRQLLDRALHLTNVG
jgi:hypothetical protein